MRVTGGIYRGKKLAVPEGMDVRPTSDKVRQAVFNVLQKYSLPQDSAVLDMFCGTGALGIEALSRGAFCCTFIDKSPESIDFCRKNIAALNPPLQNVAFLRRDAGKIGVKPPEQKAAGLIFLDPPYRKNLVIPALAGLSAGGWAAPRAICVTECEKELQDAMPAPFSVLERRPYGGTQILVLRHEG